MSNEGTVPVASAESANKALPDEVQSLLGALTQGIRAVLGPKLVGLYLWGSAVVGDFDPRLSDVDLLVALAADIDVAEFASLEQMHAGLVRQYPAWDGRVEVRYATVATLNDPDGGGEIVSISPGEALNRRRSDVRWQVDWYVVQEKGLALYGPPPASVLSPITVAQFVASVRANVSSWTSWQGQVRGHRGRAYVILLLCRALRATRCGDQLSKPAAGRWVQGELPEWRDLIAQALAWRAAPEAAPDLPLDAETERFAQDMRARILALPRTPYLSPSHPPSGDRAAPSRR